MSLNENLVTFGKYKGESLFKMLKDRKYCSWIKEQDFFKNNYEYLYNRINTYNPLQYFLKLIPPNSEDFIKDYKFFNLIPPNELQIQLENYELQCYEYYLKIINLLKTKIFERMENGEDNIYDITAPTKWLIQFERECGMPREIIKEFISSYDLPSIATIIEQIKKQGNITYNAGKSFLIAKQRSKEQENFWEQLLKNKYGENISSQFKFENCIFDFIHIKNNIIYECKLAIKDFNEAQHNKYKIVLNKFKIIYLIDKDCIIDINNQVIYTNNLEKYSEYQDNLFFKKTPNYLDILIMDFQIIEENNIDSIL
jgi:hypothetical protein